MKWSMVWIGFLLMAGMVALGVATTLVVFLRISGPFAVPIGIGVAILVLFVGVLSTNELNKL